MKLTSRIGELRDEGAMAERERNTGNCDLAYQLERRELAQAR